MPRAVGKGLEKSEKSATKICNRRGEVSAGSKRAIRTGIH
jgi:hypothetical protein